MSVKKNVEVVTNDKMKKEYIYTLIGIIIFLVIDIIIYKKYFGGTFDYITVLLGIVVPLLITINHKFTIGKIIYLLVMIGSHYYLIIDAIAESSRDCEAGFDCLSANLSILEPTIITPVIFAICTIAYFIVRYFKNKKPNKE